MPHAAQPELCIAPGIARALARLLITFTTFPSSLLLVPHPRGQGIHSFLSLSFIRGCRGRVVTFASVLLILVFSCLSDPSTWPPPRSSDCPTRLHRATPFLPSLIFRTSRLPRRWRLPTSTIGSPASPSIRESCLRYVRNNNFLRLLFLLHHLGPRGTRQESEGATHSPLVRCWSQLQACRRRLQGRERALQRGQCPQPQPIDQCSLNTIQQLPVK